MEIVNSIREQGRAARFEARKGDLGNLYNVVYRFGDEHGTRYTLLRERHYDDAEAFALQANAELDALGLLAPYSHGMTF